MINKYTIYGERCSGTNYLNKILDSNFEAKITWEYGWKHWFGNNDQELKQSQDTLFICIVRNPVDWINSFYIQQHHLPMKYDTNLIDDDVKIDIFLNQEFFSINDMDHNYKKWNKELMMDRNMYTGERYKNIFELRHTKIKWMSEDLPKKVDNYILIRYEDLLDNFENTLHSIKNKGLKVKNIECFPVNIYHRCISIGSKSIIQNDNLNNTYLKKKKIPEEMILSNPNFIDYYDIKLYNIRKSGYDFNKIIRD